MSIAIKRLAEQLGLSFKGSADIDISGVASLSSAKPGDLGFLSNTYNKELATNSSCSALIVPVGFEGEIADKVLIYSENPQLSFVHSMELISPERMESGQNDGIHPSAQIAETAVLGTNVSIGALAVIGEQVVIGSDSRIGAGCIVENDAKLGTQCHLHSRVTIAKQVRVGDRCILHSGVVLGSDGFGLVEENKCWIKVPQIGTVIVGDDVEIGANTTVDRGALDDTVIEDGCKLDNLIQVAHNVRIGAHTAIAACVGIAGSADIGQYCKISGAAVVLGHLRIVDHVIVTAMSLVTKDIKKAGVYSSGTPLLENSVWHKCNARYKSLDDLARVVKRLDKQSSQAD